MLKKKSCSRNDLINFYYSCVLFKKYFQYNLWFDSLGEYDNIKYCKKYFQKYIYCWIHIFLVQRFSLSFVMLLYKSPCFIKFVDSGFFKYLDYHFLLLFNNNCFTFDLKGKQKIKVFVKFYFQTFLKRRFEKDILILVIKATNEIILNLLFKYLTNYLRLNQTYIKQVWLKNKLLSDLVTIKDKKKNYFIGLFNFNYLIKKGYYKLCFINFNSFYITKSFYFSLSLDNTYKSSLGFISKNENKILKSYLKSAKINKVIVEKSFMEPPQIFLYRPNKDIYQLVESFSFLDRQQKYIGLYKNTSISFKDLLSQKHLLFKKSFKNCKTLLKSFNTCFVKYKYKKKIIQNI